jgi:AcrR family transcriptional regulator
VRSHGKVRSAQPSGGSRRRLDPTRDSAILDAALEGLAELGYDRLTMDEIASRAHAGKGAIYRRWPSKAALVVDAVVAWRDKVSPIAMPDTGSLEGDFEALISAFPEFDASTRNQFGVIVGLVTAAARDPELKEAVNANAFERPRQFLGEMLGRAIARGEIPAGRDLDLVSDIVIGLNLVRYIQADGPDREFIRRVLMTVVYPLVTSPLPSGANNEPSVRPATGSRG